MPRLSPEQKKILDAKIWWKKMTVKFMMFIGWIALIIYAEDYHQKNCRGLSYIFLGTPSKIYRGIEILQNPIRLSGLGLIGYTLKKYAEKFLEFALDYYIE